MMTDSVFTKKDLEGIAKGILLFLNREKIKSSKELSFLSKKNVPSAVDGAPKGMISVDSREELGTTGPIIIYDALSRGKPLEVAINPESNYSSIMFKGNFYLGGYRKIGKDSFGNITHLKYLRTTDISKIRSELETLAGE